MKKIILLSLTTLLLFNCSDSNSGVHVPPIPCNDGICLTDEQLNFFKMYLKDDTLTKKVLFEMSSMDLSSKDITSLDTGIFDNLTNLTSVDLTDNLICIVDKSDVGLTDRVNLTFDVWGCLTDEQVTFFNRHIPGITTKKELYEAPTLNLSSKSITSLDTGIFDNLTNLTSVDLTDNLICIVDKSNVGLADTVTVNLTIDARCITDEQLDFFSGYISILDTKQKLFEATSLDLSGNDLTIIPTEIGNLTSLTALLLYNNKLTNIPAEIGNLTSLTSLDLSGNDLTIIPTEIGNLTSLKTLWLNSNQLASIPAEIGNLTSLTELYLNGNKLTNIPTDIGNLTNLTILSLYENELTSIPDGLFTKLTNLTDLRLKISGPSEMNSFDCTRANYTRWGLPDPIPSTLTTSRFGISFCS